MFLATACSSGPEGKIYADIEQELDNTYAEMGKPVVSESSMKELQTAAGRKVLKRMSNEWPELIGYSLNASPDHISIMVKVRDGAEKRGEWKP